MCECKHNDWVLTSVIEYNDKWGEGSNKVLFIGSEDDCIEFAEDMSDAEAIKLCNEHASFHPDRVPQSKYFMMYPAADFNEMIAYGSVANRPN